MIRRRHSSIFSSGLKSAFCGGAFFVWMMGGSDAPADVTVPVNSETEIPPAAIATPVRVKCMRGYGVEIPLSAATSSTTKRVEFLIRAQPQFGVLGDIVREPGENDEARIIYRNRGPEGIAEDRFTYAARLSGGRVSGPAEVFIEIVEPEAVLKMAPQLPFGRVMLGTELRTDLAIANTGLKAFESEISLPSPWRVGETGSNKVRIEPGQRVVVPVFFAPQKTGAVQYTLELLPEGKGTVFLTGEGITPFSADKRAVGLTWQREGKVRKGTLRLKNYLGREQTVILECDERIQASRRIKLSDQGDFELELVLPEGDVEAFEGEMQLSNGSYDIAVDVSASAVPPVLEAAHEDGSEFHFGFVPRGMERSHSFTVKNTGGMPAPVKITVTEGFRIEEDKEAFSVAPGEGTGIAVSMDTKEMGPATGMLTIVSHEREVRIPLRGTVIENRAMVEKQRDEVDLTRAFVTDDLDARGALAAAGGSGQEEELTPEAFWEPFIPREPADLEYTKAVPTVQAINLKERAWNRLDVYWKAPEEGMTYEIQMQTLSLDRERQKMIRSWVPVTGVKFRESGEDVHARIGGLSANSRYIFRVLATNPLGEAARPSQIATTWTDVRKPFAWDRVIWGALFLGLAVLAWIRWRKRHGMGEHPVPLTPPAGG